MAVFNEPSKWQTSLVNSGDANTIPQTTPAGSGEASFEDGFPQITQVPIGAGGQAPDRKDFNGLFKVLGDWIFFAQNGGLPTYSADFDYVVGRVVIYNNNIYKCIQANDHTDPKAPSDSAYWSRIPSLSDFDEIVFNTGDIKIQTTSIIPSGWLLCNGAGVSRSTFSNLFAKIGTTYGTGNGSTTFNIPDLRDRYIIGANTNALGTYIAEQLPNITGDTGNHSAWIYSTAYAVPSSAIDVYAMGGAGTGGAGTGGISAGKIVLNANKNNSTYTDSGHVYPLSLALNFIIKC